MSRKVVKGKLPNVDQTKSIVVWPPKHTTYHSYCDILRAYREES